MQTKYIFIILLVILFGASCKTTKYVPDDAYLLNKIKIKSDVKNIGKDELSPYLRQRPNTSILGVYKMGLHVYNLSGLDTSKWINRMWRNIGDEPVIYSSAQTEQTLKQMNHFMFNKGYMDADVTVDVELRNKRATLVYTIEGNAPQHIASVKYSIRDTTLAPFIYEDTVHSIVKKEELFDVDLLEAERNRMVNLLKNKGFYYFNREYVFVEADTSRFSQQEVDVTFRTRPMLKNLPDGSTESQTHQRMKVRSITIIPWYDTNKKLSEQITDTIYHKGYRFLYDKKIKLKPEALASKIHINIDDYYKENDVEKTYASLNSLGVTKYVNIYFREAEENGYLKCYIILSPTKIQSISTEIEGTNTEGDIGAAFSVRYQHRNIFRGSELFSLKARTAYQPMGELSNLLSDNSFEWGGEASVTFPRVLFPFLSDKIKKRIRASTEISASFNKQTNPWYVRNIAGAALKYVWVTGSRNNERYSIDLLDINYVYLPQISDSFRDTYLNSSSVLKYSYEDHFIMRTGFSFSRNTYISPKSMASYFSYRGGVETAGNVLSAINSLTNAKKNENGSYEILNIPYAQYVKGEFDYAFTTVLDDKNRFVYRFNIGVAYPYGNADVVPFEKRFYAGGANSVRGWSVRTLGPGLYKSQTSGTDFHQTGDVKIDINWEYRFKLFWVLEGAFFLDGGNVWTIKKYEDQLDGAFDFKQFYKQMGYSYGLGLRFDFSFFLFRIDTGVRLYDPVQEGSNKWRIPMNRDDFAFHFAIGYPF